MTTCYRWAIPILALLLPAMGVAAVATTSWPPIHDGLGFAWSTAFEPAQALDSDGKPRLGWQFTPKGHARLNHHGALVLDGGGFVAEGVSEWLGKSIGKSGACSVVLWIHPGAPAPQGTILHLGDDTGISISQTGSSLHAAGSGAKVEADLPEGGGPFALALALSDVGLALYVNGEKRAESSLETTVGVGELPPLTLGKPEGGAGWTGTAEGLAIYARALAPAEIEALATACADIVRARNPLSQLQVRARLAGKSTVMEPRDLAPYTQGLCVYRYEIVDVLAGDYAESYIHVAHWMVLDQTLLPFSGAEIGSEHTLTLERLEENPQLDAENLSDDIVDDFSLPYYFDAGGCSTATAPKD